MKALHFTCCFFLLLLPTTLGVPVPTWPSPYWNISGSFCQSTYPQMECCAGRKDRCSVPIFDTRCYCDTFCNRTGSADCCPDYFSHCEGLSEDKYYEQTVPAQTPILDKYYEQTGPEPATILGPPTDCPHGVLDISDPVCLFSGRLLSDRDILEDNCNQCKCQVSRSKPGCMEVLCTTFQCMLEEKVITELKDGKENSFFTWKPANFSEFWGKTLEEGINGKLGADKPDIPAALKAHHMSAVQLSYSPSTLPEQFNAENAWPGLISSVTDQGWCSSSWAVSAVAVAGDRTSIGQDSPVVLSPQALLSCNKRGPVGCVSSQVDHAWNQLRRHGSWSSSCQSETSFDSCPSHCQMHRTLPAYMVGRGNTPSQPHRNEQDIMYELMTEGPVQSIMEVHTDFFMYGSGVYQKTNLASNTALGYHAVRIVGWGQEGGLRYWRVANSWRAEWGEEGFFKIARGDNECLVEEFVMAVWPRKKRTPRMRRHGERSADRFSSGLRQRNTRHGKMSYKKEEERGVENGKERYFQA